MPADTLPPMIFTGTANPELAKRVCQHLQLPLGKATASRFSDGEILVEILENVRGRDIFIIQSTNPPAENILELSIMADALHRASANSITAVVPYFGYARQDRRVRSRRVPISARVLADMLQSVGVKRMVTVDLHADQIQGFFDIPVDNVYGTPVMYQDILAKKLPNLMVVSPDVGGVVRARAIAKCLHDADLAIIDKRRPKTNHAEVMNLIGDVSGRNCIIVDDMIDTGGTLCAGVEVLKQEGASSVRAYCTHAVLSGNAIENIENSSIDELIVTDSIALQPNAQACKKIRQLSLADILAKTVSHISDKGSISAMFDL